MIAGAGADVADAGTNGRLSASELAPIGSCTKLAREAAAAFNTMRLAAPAGLVSVNGCDSAYRSYARQVFWRSWWCARGRCGNAAVPGTSNHGVGRAIDTACGGWVIRNGAAFGWSKRLSDAPHECWHVRYTPGLWTRRPDPGLDRQNPRLSEGSGGRGQAEHVKKAQRLLRRHGAVVRVDGDFGRITRRAVYRFQAARKLAADGRIGIATWRALRGPVVRERAAVVPLPPVPARGPVTGPDVSVYQGSVDWPKVRAAGHDFAIQKASEGEDFRDRTLSAGRLEAIRRAGLVAGVYHFLRPKPGRAGAVEATFAVQTARAAGWRRGDLRLVADVESTRLSPAGTCSYVRSFARRVKALTGAAPIIYTFPSFARAQLAPCAEWIRTLPSWRAHYGTKVDPWPWAREDLWQFTDRGTVPGIRGGVDVNRIRGGAAVLERLRLR